MSNTNQSRARETKQLLYTACRAIDSTNTNAVTANAAHTARQLSALLVDLLQKKDIAPPMAAIDLINAAIVHLQTIIGHVRHSATRTDRHNIIDPVAWAAIQSAALIFKALARDLAP
jgi:hypothetical protein